RRRHTRFSRDWSSDVCSSDLRRYVRASDGVAEAWVIDGDPRAYARPAELDPDDVVQRGGTSYMAVEDMEDLLGLTYAYGRNGYRSEERRVGKERRSRWHGSRE